MILEGEDEFSRVGHRDQVDVNSHHVISSYEQRYTWKADMHWQFDQRRRQSQISLWKRVQEEEDDDDDLRTSLGCGNEQVTESLTFQQSREYIYLYQETSF